MIVSFKSRALKRYWTKGQERYLPPDDIERIDILLSHLDEATAPEDMNIAGFQFHALAGDQKGRYAVSVNANWRVTFGFEGEDAIDIDFEDYH